MRVRARAPGKVVVLGEYAVLTGAPALVLAVDREVEVEVEVEPAAGSGRGRCSATLLAAQAERLDFSPPRPSGSALIDLVLARDPEAATLPPWRARLDSRAFFDQGRKLGIGSSAAALTAWAGAYGRYQQAHGREPSVSCGLEALVFLHRAFQGGHGSGVDVAASLGGGLVRYVLEVGGRPRMSSVALPMGVGFAGIFSGKSASTADFVERFDAWRRARPEHATDAIERLGALARAGADAAEARAPAALLETATRYGTELEALGRAIGVEIVTREHREIGREAHARGVAYKVSGAGGGDLGLAMSSDLDALEAFKSAVAASGYRVVDLLPATRGLVVEEHPA